MSFDLSLNVRIALERRHNLLQNPVVVTEDDLCFFCQNKIDCNNFLLHLGKKYHEHCLRPEEICSLHNSRAGIKDPTIETTIAIKKTNT